MTPSTQTTPVDWQDANLGELLKFSNGINADKSAYGSGVPFANVLEVITNESLREEDIPGRITLPREILDRYDVRRGDVLFNRTSETQREVGLASVYFGEESIVFGGFVMRGRPVTNAVDPDYFKYALRAPYVRSQIMSRGQGGIRANIGQRDLKSVVVVLPTVQEQRVIARTLDDATQQIKLLERLIAKKRAIKQGMMQQLLNGKTRLPGFTEPWESRRLSDLLSYEQPGRYLVSTSEQLDVGRTPVLTAGKTFILGYTNDTHGIYSGQPVIIFDDFTTASKYVDFGFKAKSSAMKVLSAKAGVNIRFVYERMQLIDFPLGDHKRYWISEYSNQELLVPCESEQSTISAVIADVDGEIEMISRGLTKARAIKHGMMQELLSGRTRLPVPESSG